MQDLLVVVAPGLLMLFALAMQRLEERLGKTGPSEEQVKDFLRHANPEEMEALLEEGMPEALDIFDGRREQARTTSPISEA